MSGTSSKKKIPIETLEFFLLQIQVRCQILSAILGEPVFSLVLCFVFKNLFIVIIGPLLVNLD